jgi:hypothetical protein
MGSKFGNKKATRVVGGEVYEFDSKDEAKRFDELLAMLRAGVIEKLTLQPEFIISPRVYDKAVGRWLPARKYIADFRYIKDGKVIVEDVKSEATRLEKLYRLKRHLFLEKYGDEMEFSEITYKKIR